VTARSAVRSLVVIALALLVQSTVVGDIRIDGVIPNLMLLVPIAAGIAAGPARGAVVGFTAGLAADLLLPTPFGLTALVGTLVGFTVGATSGSVVREVRWFSAVVALAASAAAVMLYAVLGAVLGQQQFLHVDLVLVVTVVSVANALLAVPAVGLERWALAPEADRSAASGRW
jgi:rod shape-determining protein MreD